LKPYYKDNYVTIYHGDCREILPQLELETVITDPVWPNAAVKMQGQENPSELFREMCLALPRAERLVVHLGCDSDPRFLSSVPSSWPFLRICNLDYARPHYKGRILYGGDIAYVFGIPPAAREGRFLMPGRCIATRSDKQFLRHTKNNHKRIEAALAMPHPTPRRLDHLTWLVNWFSNNSVCDPFLGSGTTAVAAKYLNRKCIGIEIEEKYCEIAANRCRQSVMELNI
jgi:site-specific DNA-methyltransferase (adenine-specific)